MGIENVLDNNCGEINTLSNNNLFICSTDIPLTEDNNNQFYFILYLLSNKNIQCLLKKF